jgi:glyoxylase-like metal-dependent hydrolase (beta-lactamase superfamily II)
MKRTIMLAGWIGLAALPGAVFGFQVPAPDAPKVIDVEKIKDNFYVLKGGGGNTSVFITQNNGVVVVDTKNPGWGPLLVEKIKSITDKPVTTIINTHTHADHTSGNPYFPAGVQIIAQENTKANMEKMDLFKKPENAKFLPTKTYKDKLKLFSGPDEVDLYYFGAAGTNGDSWVVFPSLRIMAAGDDFAGKTVTFLDESNGGSGAFAQTLKNVVKRVKNVDIVIPGHSTAMFTWADFKEWADFNQELVDWVLAEKKAGKSVDDAIAEYKIPAKYAGYTPPQPRFVKATITAIYNTPGLG